MRISPVNVILAHTEIDGRHVNVHVDAPKEIHVQPGAAIHVKHAYRLDETLGRDEECQVSLTADVDGRHPQTRSAHFHDRFGHRNLMGCLTQEFVVHDPGRHELHYRIGLDYGQSNHAGEVQRTAHEAKAGSLRVIVD